METSTISSFGDFHEYVSKNISPNSLCRGVTDIERHQLIPSVGRFLPRHQSKPDPRRALERSERDALRIFAVECASFLGRPIQSKWELLAIAQHHGLPTRLLDWTLNPLIALFFASNGAWNVDGAVYSVKIDLWIDNETEAKQNPFDLQEIRAFMPAHVAPRIKSQSGIFSIQPDPTVPFSYPGMKHVVVKAGAKRNIQSDLLRYGIHEKALYADLDGLAAWIRRIKFAP